MGNYIVYMHINKINNKKYIGITKQKCQDRWRHDGTGYKTQPKFYNAIQKYGWNNFEHVILFSDLSAYEAGEKEKILIKQFDSCNNGYNTSLGGNTTNHSQETIEKIRKAMIGKTHSLETKQKIKLQKEASQLRVQCLETKIIYDSLHEASKKTGIDISSIIKSCKGQTYRAGGYTWRYADLNVAELYEKYTNGRKDNTKKSVICIETGKIYESATEAAKDVNGYASNIIKVCKGKNKTSAGFKWAYYERQGTNNE